MYDKAKKIDMLFEVLRTALSLFIAMILVVVIIFFVSGRPFEALEMLFLRPFASTRNIGNIIEFAIPLTFTGLGLTLIFRAKQINLAVDSGFHGGAMAATLVGLYLGAPPVVVVILAILAATLMGGVIGAIPAVVKEKTGASELVISLMLNFVVGSVVLFFLTNVVRSSTAMALQSENLPSGVTLPVIISGTRIHLGVIFALICVVAVSIFLFRTKWGYALRMTGSSREFAHYSGMPVSKVVVWTQIIGCAIAGFGGAIELLGMHSAFRWVSSPGFGFDAIIVAVLAKLNPVLVPVTALFLAYIRVGADILNRSGDVPFEIISVVQATVIILIAATGFLRRLKQKTLEKQALLAKQESEGGSGV